MSIQGKANNVYGMLKQNANNQPKMKFGYDASSGILDQIYNNNKSIVDRTANYDIGRAKAGTAARNPMVTGSLKEDLIGNAGNNIIQNKYDTYGKLGTGLMEGKLGAMEMDNRNTVTQQQLKNQALQQLASFLPTLMNADNQPTILDDIFSGLNLGANVLGIPTGANKTLFNNIFG